MENEKFILVHLADKMMVFTTLKTYKDIASDGKGVLFSVGEQSIFNPIHVIATEVFNYDKAIEWLEGNKYVNPKDILANDPYIFIKR